jgi:hypothetical protein
MGRSPLYNPYAPTTGHSTVLDHFEFAEEEEQDAESNAKQLSDQMVDLPPGVLDPGAK